MSETSERARTHPSSAPGKEAVLILEKKLLDPPVLERCRRESSRWATVLPVPAASLYLPFPSSIPPYMVPIHPLGKNQTGHEKSLVRMVYLLQRAGCFPVRDARQ